LQTTNNLFSSILKVSELPHVCVPSTCPVFLRQSGSKWRRCVCRFPGHIWDLRLVHADWEAPGGMAQTIQLKRTFVGFVLDGLSSVFGLSHECAIVCTFLGCLWTWDGDI